MAGKEGKLDEASWEEYRTVLAKGVAIARDLVETLHKSGTRPGVEVAYAFAFGLIKLCQCHAAVPGDYAGLAKDVLDNALNVIAAEEAAKARPS